jgi:L-ascorbate metabolism protein UlaG (beta-lactamase superfamily)
MDGHRASIRRYDGNWDKVMKKFKKALLFFVLFFALLFISIAIFMNQSQFGKNPSGSRKEAVLKSPNFRDGKFQNLSHTPDLTEGVSYYTVIKEFFFDKKPRLKPQNSLPSIKTDLLHLNPAENVLVWFGHSSYFLQLDGKRILVDPVLSGGASPIKFTTPSFAGSDIYTVQDFPEIDYLFISHDHYDHLDYETIIALKPKIKQVICGLGVGEHFKYWGYDNAKIIEKDWYEEINLGNGFEVALVPARHFSGRGLKRNQSLWVSFVLKTPNQKIFIGGDSGYDTHFSKIGQKYGEFDLAILECGQYDKSWKYIHLMPEEVVKAAQDLKAKRLLPVHWGKFVLGNHSWDDPIIRVSTAAQTEKMPILTPMIGEKIMLNDTTQVFKAWWQEVK